MKQGNYNQGAEGHQGPPKLRPLLTYAEAAELLAINTRTLSRRIAAGRYRTYGEGNGKRILYSSILDDIRRECGDGVL
jgi:excisionase family DNA binding protein